MGDPLGSHRQKWTAPCVFVWCALILVLLALGVYFGPQTITYYKFRPSILRSPDVSPRGWSSVPQPLADTTASTADGNLLSYDRCTVEVPWKEIYKKWNERGGSRILFKTGQIVTLYGRDSFGPNLISGVRLDPGLDADYFKLAFGSGVHESMYEQFRAVISSAPSQLSPFRSRKEFARTWILLEIKGLWFEHNSDVPEIFSFETKSYRGFETRYGNYRTELHFFDKAKDQAFLINISSDTRSPVRLTQPEINRVIQSFVATPSLQTNSLPK